MAETYYLNTRNRDGGGSAELKSLEVDDAAVTLEHPRGTKDTAYVTTVAPPEQVTVEWVTNDPHASVRAYPRDADSEEDGHQFDLGDPNEKDTLVLKIVSENKKDTAHYGLVVQRANNVATLKTLSPITEDFEPATTKYTATTTDSTIRFSFTKTDTDASTNPTSPYTAKLGTPGSKTTVSITVTAEDRKTKTTYTVVVTRSGAGVLLKDMDGDPYAGSMVEGATDTIKMSLGAEPMEDSTVTVTTTSTSVLSVGEGTTLTFTSLNWETAQNVIVTAGSDDDAEPEDENLYFALSGDAGTGYDSKTDTVDVTVTETDTKGVILSATAKEVNEAVAGSYSVVLNSQPVGSSVVIQISGAPNDVTLGTSQLTFTTDNWSTAQSVSITPTNDTDTASHSAFDLSHAALGGGYSGLDIDDVEVQVLDDEAAQVVITTTAVTVNESGTFTYAIALTDAPSADETVTVRLGFNTADFQASVNSVALTSGNYSDGVEVTITAQGVTADATKTISHTVSVADTSTDDQVYEDGDPASSIKVKVKNVP